MKTSSKSSDGNFVRRKTDYLVMLIILGTVVAAAEHYFPDRSSQSDKEAFGQFYDMLNLRPKYGLLASLALWWLITTVTMHSITWVMYTIFKRWSPEHTSDKHFWSQFKAIATNFILLPIVQVILDAIQEAGFTKATMGNLSPLIAVRDACLWMFCFEWAWYFQHRLMHDNKFLWELGHSYHHSWRKPEHMIGITNFAFDHIVEVWVTMSSSFLGYLLFPSNFFVGKAISLFYMVLAVAAHWEGNESTRYHINHHYLVTKNYGSHIPVFDILFGTYQWDEYVHPESIKKVADAAKKL